MEKIKLLIDAYKSLNKRNRMIALAVSAVALILILELLTGCTTISKTWSF